MTNITHNIAAGIRLSLRNEDFLVTDVKKDIIEAEGISELVKGMRFTFDLSLEYYDVITPESTQLVADESNGYRKTKLFIETILRNSSFYSEGIEIANKAAIRPSKYQFEPTMKALALPKPRILIADGVGLGKTIQVGIFLTEMIRRGKGQRILVVTPKSILSQFQQEIWSRFSIPLVRLDSVGVDRINAIIPSNKNPFDYYDKVIVSIDTLKNNGKFRHHLEKIKWDIVAIDECHNVANDSSQRGELADFLSHRSEALVLTSATPHNGKKKNFANLITLLDPTAIPYNGEFTPEDIRPLFVRRFKKDVENEVGDSFRDRVTTSLHSTLFQPEEEVLELIQNARNEAFTDANGDMTNGTLLFTIGLFKAYMSSPAACLETINNRLDKNRDEELITTDFLLDIKRRLENILNTKADGKLNELINHLKAKAWKGRKQDERIIIFAERRKTLDYLEEQLKATFNIDEKAIVQFNGSLSDTDQQKIIDDFSKEDSSIRLFLASDAGSQGVNLHYHCHTMFNYDIPWSIITLEQRNGRIDRFGQTNTPNIYYLISKSEHPAIKDDFRILDKLKEKEEEVYKSLGDAASLWMLYDTNKEEKLITKAFAKGDVSLLDDKQKDDEIDWEGIFDVIENKATESDIFEKPHSSFYSGDFKYYATLIDELKSDNSRLTNEILVDHFDETIEFVQTEELCGKKDETTGVLYDIPEEAFPDRKDTFKLTCDKDVVEKAIEKARKKEGWPTQQLLYDMHPLARWLQFKILARIDKGNAPVVRMRNPLPEKSAWFVFQGITSNGKGQAILSKAFVISRSFIGGEHGNMDSFDDFVSHYRLFDELPTLPIEQTHLDLMQAMLPDAVKSARNLYTQQLQGNLADDIEDKLTLYEKKLASWLQESERQLEIQFGDEDTGGVLKYQKNKRKHDIAEVHKVVDEFYKSYFQLENDPYLRLLAVFYNA